MALRDILVRFGISVDQTQLVDAQRNVNSLVIQFKQLQRIAGFAIAAIGIGVITESADKYINLANRLRAVTKSAEEFAVAEKGVFDIARATFTPVEDVAALYQRFTQVTSHLGKSQIEVLGFTEQLTMAMKLGGSTAAEASGALLQFGQGLGNNFKSGGQELNSIIEQSPKLAQILADVAGTNVAGLKAAAKAGKLTAEAIFKGMNDAWPELQAEFVKRAKSFEDVKIAFGIEWLALMKQLAPTFAVVTRALLDLVTWTKEWVSKGEALNTMIAGLVVVVGALAFAFGPLIAQVLLAAAPFIALFLIIEDFVTFMRGGESIIGDFMTALFGENGQDKVRQHLQDLWEVARDFMAWVSDPNSATWEAFYTGAKKWIDMLVDAMQAAMLKIAEFIQNDPLLGPIASLIKATTAAPGTATEDKTFFQKTPAELVGEIGNGFAGAFDSAFAGGPNQLSNMLPPDLAPPSLGSLGAGSSTTSNVVNGAPVTVNNTVTVQGNATSATAREIADKTGTATVSAVGRDRSAVGAAFGMVQ